MITRPNPRCIMISRYHISITQCPAISLFTIISFQKKSWCFSKKTCVFFPYQSKILKNTINLPFEHMFPLYIPSISSHLPSTSLVNPGIQSSSTMNSRSMARRLWSDPSIPLISSAPGRGQQDGNSMVIHGIIVEAQWENILGIMGK